MDASEGPASPANPVERSPLKFGVFVMASCFWVVDLSVACYILAEYWRRLPPRSGAWLTLVVFGLTAVWANALVYYCKMSGFFKDRNQSDSDSRFEQVIDSARGFFSFSLFFVFFLSWILLTQILAILQRF